MAITAAVEVDVNINGGKEVKEVNDNLKTLNDVSKATAEGLNSATKSTTLMGNATGKLRESLNNASKGFSTLKNDLSAIPGPVGFVVQGFTGLQTAFKAIIANPIGLVLAGIAAALTTLYKVFTSTKEGAEQFRQALDAVSAAIDVIRDRALTFGTALKQLFSGDIRAGLNSIKQTFSGITTEIAEEARQAANLRRELQAVIDDQRALNIERAKQNTLVAESKLQINDENLSYEQRLKALEEVRKSEIALAKQEEALALRRYNAIKAQNALSDSSQEALDAEANAYITLQNAQRTSLTVQKELFDQEKALRDRQKAEQKAARDERAAADKAEQERLQKQADEEFELFVAQGMANAEYQQKQAEENAKQQEENFQRELEQDIANYEYRKALAEKEAKETKERKQAVADLERQLFNESVALANAVIALAGEQSAIGKSVALASIAADTAMALTKALSNSQSPTPDNVATGGLAGIAKYISLATTILSNSKRAYDIIKAPAPSVSGSVSTTSVPTFNAPSVRLNAGNNDFTQTNKIYVTEDDISNTQSKVRVTEGLSQF